MRLRKRWMGRCHTMSVMSSSAAIDAATRDAEASGLREPVVLLSPACASFDQYPNFEVRGNTFTDFVLAISGVTASVNAS